MNLKGWKYLLTFGYDLDIYAKGDHRVGIDRKTGEVVIEYAHRNTKVASQVTAAIEEATK